MGLFGVSRDKQMAEIMAPQWLKIACDCAKITNTTKSPDVFFERYGLLIKTLEDLSGIEKYVRFKGSKPSAILRETIHKKSTTIHDFLERYYQDTQYKMIGLKTKKAKESKAEAFLNSLTFFSDRMDATNISEYTQMYENLLQLSRGK